MGLFSKNKESHKTAAHEIGVAQLDNGTEVKVANTVDCIGDSCPRPQLMTRKAVDTAAPGDIVAVVIDNPTSVEAIPPMCPGLGATHLETRREGNAWQVFLRKN
jgi:tRNA 2-thiouridine synthesizing protein A